MFVLSGSTLMYKYGFQESKKLTPWALLLIKSSGSGQKSLAPSVFFPSRSSDLPLTLVGVVITISSSCPSESVLLHPLNPHNIQSHVIHDGSAYAIKWWLRTWMSVMNEAANHLGKALHELKYNHWIHKTSENKRKSQIHCPVAQSDVIKWLVLWEQNIITMVYSNMWERKAGNAHIWEPWTKECLQFLLRNDLK